MCIEWVKASFSTLPCQLLQRRGWNWTGQNSPVGLVAVVGTDTGTGLGRATGPGRGLGAGCNLVQTLGPNLPWFLDKHQTWRLACNLAWGLGWHWTYWNLPWVPRTLIMAVGRWRVSWNLVYMQELGVITGLPHGVSLWLAGPPLQPPVLAGLKLR